MTIFRARHITLGTGKAVTDVVTQIVKVNVPDGVEFNFQVRGTTISAQRISSSSIPQSDSSLVYFHGNIPEKFKLARNTEAERITNGQHGHLERSMEVDSNFIGATTLYEPPLDTPVKAE